VELRRPVGRVVACPGGRPPFRGRPVGEPLAPVRLPGHLRLARLPRVDDAVPAGGDPGVPTIARALHHESTTPGPRAPTQAYQRFRGRFMRGSRGRRRRRRRRGTVAGRRARCGPARLWSAHACG
jgi:hypothetical protein